MAILLALVVFILSIDQHNLTKVLYRPFVSCTIIGLILGDLSTGVTVGSTFELLLIAFETSQYFEIDCAGYFLGGITATILSICAEYDTYSAISAGAMVGAFAVVIHMAITGVTTVFLPSVRKAIEQNKCFAIFNFIPTVVEGLIYAVLTVFIYNGLDTFLESFNTGFTAISWIVAGVAICAKLLPALGLAVLARNLSLKDYKGALCIGLVLGAILVNSFADTSLVLGMLAVFGVAAYEYSHFSSGITLPNRNPDIIATISKKEENEKPMVILKDQEEKSDSKETTHVEERPILEQVKEKIEDDIQPLKLEKDPAKEEKVKQMEEDSKAKGEDEVWW